MEDKLDLSHYHWDLTIANSVYDGDKFTSSCLRAPEFLNPDVEIFQSDTTKFIVPTDNGWLSLCLDDSASIETDSFEWNSGHQFTIELEVMPIDTDYTFYIFPQKDPAGGNQIYLLFDNTGMTTGNPSLFT